MNRAMVRSAEGHQVFGVVTTALGKRANMMDVE
jgi:hypothetical protein